METYLTLDMMQDYEPGKNLDSYSLEKRRYARYTLKTTSGHTIRIIKFATSDWGVGLESPRTPYTLLVMDATSFQDAVDKFNEMLSNHRVPINMSPKKLRDALKAIS